ncbi:MAG: PAS domain S-box protein [Desulfobacterales bacterium]|nr:PAS domain S-box protein [Desulfobacterales bacterium]
MAEKPTYEALEQKVKELEQEAVKRKRVEEALRESEERYRQIFNIAPAGIYELDYRTGKIVDANDAVCEYSGYTKDELLSLNSVDLLTEESLDKFLKRATKVMNGENVPDSADYEVLKKDGSIICLNISNRYIYDGENIVGATVVARDITEHKRAEEALRESEERFRLAFHTSPDSININRFDDGVYIDINDGFAKILGYTREDVIGKSSLSLNIWKDPEDRKRLVEGLTQTGYVENLEARFVGKSGKIIVGLMSARVSRISGENVIISITRDITDRKQAEKALRESEERLQQSNKMESIGTLAGGIAHDFNNILFPIVGYTEMLLEDTPEDSPLRHCIDEIYSGTLRARELVKQILTFSRQGRNEIKLIRIQPLIIEALKLIRSTIPTSIEIVQDVSNDCGIIKADPTQIHQIVMNLATNAYHAMEETGGALKVGLEEIELGAQDVISPGMKPGRYACLTVADAGVGIDKNVREKIFDPFFTTKEQGKGTGMGLAVVHGIVQSAGGSIQVSSNPGQGTKFHVFLPVVKSASAQQTIPAKEPIQRGTEHILLVDDEEVIAEMETMMLERLGYQVVSRTSSVDALEAFRVNPDKFDLVITDMAMPNMSGDQLASELVKIRPDVSILLCTGFSERMPEEKAKALGIKNFLMKPITLKDLSEKIREVLDNAEN